jgi:RNA polymerase sigma-70 factor (ECF subfamily)
MFQYGTHYVKRHRKGHLYNGNTEKLYHAFPQSQATRSDEAAMSKTTDADLVYRCLEGDAEAFRSLVQRYERAVYATAYVYVGRFGGAEDVAQEAFWAAYRSLPHLKQPDKFGAWMKEITVRTAANWLRKNLSRIRHETQVKRFPANVHDLSAADKDPAQQREILERVQNAIEALPERYRLPVVLRYMQEMSYEEISQFIGETPAEVRGILYRAARQLRENLADLYGQMDEEDDASWHRAHK